MSYMHIDNLYKDQTILDFEECYAMEKIHGTSAHVRYQRESKIPSCVGEEHLGDFPQVKTIEKLVFFSGGEKHDRFVELFDYQSLLKRFSEIFPDGAVDVTVYGEAYGGKCQGMSKTYGKDLRFVAFEVRVGDTWVNVVTAEQIVRELGLEFIHYRRIPATMVSIDHEMMLDSVQAIRNGMGPGLMREGIVLRPLQEMVRNNGARVIAKHKRPEFCETASKREVDPSKRQLLEDAEAIASEWVTKERMNHVVDRVVSDGLLPEGEDVVCLDIKATGVVIKAMIEDVVREAGEEIMDSKEARKAIGARAAKLYKIFLQEKAWVPVVTLSEKGMALNFVMVEAPRGHACTNVIGHPGEEGPVGALYTDYPHAVCDGCGWRLGDEVLDPVTRTAKCGRCGGTYHLAEPLKRSKT